MGRGRHIFYGGGRRARITVRAIRRSPIAHRRSSDPDGQFYNQSRTATRPTLGARAAAV
jgi:hypothetical protein